MVDWSCRLYARLLAILPGSFRQDYHQPILLAFQDLCLNAWQERGPFGLVPVWMQALPDLADGAAGEWQLSLALGGNMERVSVRSWLLMALVTCAVLLAYVLLPDHAARYVIGLLAVAAIMSVAVSGWRSRFWRQAASSVPGSNLVSSDSRTSEMQGPFSRIRSVLIGLELALLVLLVYVVYFFFRTQPDLSAAHHFMVEPNQIITDRLVGILILGAYLAVTIYATRSRGPSAGPWLVGITAGTFTSLVSVFLACAIRLDAVLIVMLSIAFLAGLTAGRLAGQTEAGALGGFWFGLACALVWVIVGMIVDLTQAPWLARTAWASSHYYCIGLAGNTLAACAIGNDLSDWGKVLLALPIVSGGLGVIGGLIGSALTKARPPVEAKWGRALIAPVGFCSVMIVLFVAGMVGLLR